MNDRYLYRAKRTDNGEWVEGFFVNAIEQYGNGERMADIIPLDAIREFDCISPTFMIDPSTICQFTGLTDKHGKKIWENDVVEIGEHQDNVNGLYKVIYCENAHCYALKRSVDFYYNFFTFSDLNGFETSSKVIGNIFDNPELLESEG